MRLVFITQHVDPAHPVLAATVPKLAALAERVDEVAVLADGAVPGVLPEGCRVYRFASAHKLGRGLRFEAALARELARRPRPVAVVAHMCPIYAVLAAPLARPLGVPVLLWYTQWQTTRALRLAERLASGILSVDRRSFPFRSPKVRAIGHGIDLAQFPCRPRGEAEGFRAVVAGRYSAAKGLDVIVRAVRIALDRGLDLRLEVHGPALNAHERAQRADLERLVAELELGQRVRLGHAVLRSELPDVFARADVLVNNMRAGSPDKVVYEAAASCVPVVASNPVFDELLDGLVVPLRFPRESPQELADRLASLVALTVEDRARIGRALRDRVAARHSVQSWAEGVLEAIRR